MLKINIFVNGKVSEKAVLSGIKEYSKRLGRFCKITEKSSVPDSFDDPTVVFLIGDGIPKSQEYISSVELSGKIDGMMTGGVSKMSIALVDMDEFKNMGNLDMSNTSVYGLTKGINDKSLGLLMLYEQIYRVFKISAGEAYHK